MSTRLIPRRSKDGQHFANLGDRGAKFVKTAQVTETHVKLGHVTAAGEILVGYGPNGLGKSVASHLATNDWVKRLGWEMIAIHASAMRQTNMTKALLAGALGIDEARETWRTGFRVQEELAKRKLILRIDEASYLNAETLGWLRDIHSDGDATWALFLTGNSELRKKLEKLQPELLDRAERVVAFEPLTMSQALTFARHLHPRLDRTNEDLLGVVNNRWGHGRPRRWAQHLKACLDIDPNGQGGFSKRTVDVALKALVR